MDYLRSLPVSLSLVLCTLLYGQQDLSILVKKPCSAASDLTYYGSPVHPKAFFDLNSTDIVDLRVYRNDMGYYTMADEQAWIKWPDTCQKEHSYGYYYKDSSYGYRVNWDMWYVPLGQLADCRYVILWHCYGGPHLNYTYVTTVSIQGNYLINQDFDYITCDLDYPIVLHGNEIINGSKQYKIRPMRD